MAKYGIPYMGSKQSICDKLIKIFPKAENFYDVFGGGFSVTHAMILRRSNHFKNFYFNEIRPGICELIQDAIDGKYSYDVFKPEWISRERFLNELDKNAYVKMCWSFGNDGKSYLFSKEIEPYKKSMHNAIIFNEFDDLAKEVIGLDKFADGYSIKNKRLFLGNKIEYYRKNGIPKVLHKFISKEQLQHLQQLKRLQQLQQLQQLQRLNFTNLSYEQIKIKPNSIIYCDPPYAGTHEYDNKFNTAKFLDWADAQENPVFISEYDIKDKRFCLVKKISKVAMLDCGVGRKSIFEKVYLNEAGRKMLL